MENKIQDFLIKNIDKDIKKKIKMLSVEKELNIPDVIKLLVEFYEDKNIKK